MSKSYSPATYRTRGVVLASSRANLLKATESTPSSGVFEAAVTPPPVSASTHTSRHSGQRHAAVTGARARRSFTTSIARPS